MIGETVQDKIAALEARCMQRARNAPPVLRVSLDDAGKHMPQKARARGDESAEWRLLGAEALKIVAPQHRQLGKILAPLDLGEIGAAHQSAQSDRPRLCNRKYRLQVTE